MKYLLVLTLALFTIASCESFFRPNLEELKDHRPIDDLRYFFLTIFDQFNLTEPTEIVSCFNDKTARLFFDTLYEFHKTLNDTKERNHIRLHLDYAKIAILSHALKGVKQCVFRTKNFQDLLDTLDVDVKARDELEIIQFVYYQARFASLLNDYTPVIKGLDDNNNRKAGIAYSRVISNMRDTIKLHGMYYIANQAWGNGFAWRMGLSDPKDSLRCWNDEQAAVYLEFFLKLSETVSNGKWNEAPINTHFFWRDYGKKIMERIPKETFICVQDSKDNSELVELLGIDIYDEEFLDLMLTWINDNRLKYWGMMKGMKESFDRYDLGRAGAIYAQFVKSIAKLNPDESSDSSDSSSDSDVFQDIDN